MKLAAFRRRLLFRGVFLLLALATVALALVLLQEEKERSYANWRQAFKRSQADVLARLREPAGLLALLNPQQAGDPTPLRPLVLPYPALDIDDLAKAQQAVDDAGCAVRYADGATLCAGVGSSAYAGAYLYLVGSFRAGDLVMRESGSELDIESVHRASIRVESRGELRSWVLPFERLSMRGEPLVRGRLLTYDTGGDPTLASARAVRDARGWLSQSAACAGGSDAPDCPRRVAYAIRLPLEALRESAAGWPPPDLDLMRVHVQLLAPGNGPALFSSDAAGAEAPSALDELAQALLPGEVLTITRRDARRPVIVLRGDAADAERSSPLILRLIDRLPVSARPPAMTARDTLATPVGTYEVQLAGDARGIDRGLGATATRMSWYVAAMLGAIALAWLVIEVGLIRRISVLTQRAAAVSQGVQLDVSDLRGPDELGILAGSLADLLAREKVRAQQERDMLQAVGHEILSPLQSLMVLHPQDDDPARRYVQRMQQAVRVLYGQASPSEALQAAQLQLAPLDLDAFLRHVADNAQYAGIADVRYESAGTPLAVRADEFSLEDVVTHILRNADRHRTPGTPVTLALQAEGAQAVVRVHNAGTPIDDALLARIFDYGVRDVGGGASPEHRGQGLFVARTYMAKMGGTVSARNEAGGVSFYLALPLALSP